MEFRFEEEAHKYFLNNQEMPSVTFVLDAMGFISDFAKKEEYRIRGQYVHTAMALYGHGRLDWATLDPRLLGFVLSGVRFYEEMDFRPSLIEIPAFHPDFLYGFTIDALGESRQGPLLPDFKTGKAMLPATRLQLAAYREGARQKYGTKFKTLAVELDEDGGMPNFKFLGNERGDWNDFLACLTVTRLRENHHG